jgi:hypothetical protein
MDAVAQSTGITPNTVVVVGQTATPGTLVSLNNQGYLQLQVADGSMVYFPIVTITRVDVAP